MSALHKARQLVVLCVAIVVYVVAHHKLPKAMPDARAPELLVSLPRAAQIMLAIGDRYLAANLSGFRVLVADTQRMSVADYAVQARLQSDVSWFNPAHEDNYYIAAALLAWNKQLEASQFVLRRAANKRVMDYQPVFYCAFNYFYFFRDPVTAAQLLLEGAQRPKNQQDQWAMENLAAKWLERGYETAEAAKVVSAMAGNAPEGGFKKYLTARAMRLQHLAQLQAWAREYQQRYERPITSLDQLVQAGLTTDIPKDPLGIGFTVSPQGEPVFRK